MTAPTTAECEALAKDVRRYWTERPLSMRQGTPADNVIFVKATDYDTLHSTLRAVAAERDAKDAELRLFLKAGVGNSTDFVAQAEAINAARAALGRDAT